MTDDAHHYSRRPAEVWAVQWTGDNFPELRDFVGVQNRTDGGWFDGAILGHQPEPTEIWIAGSNRWATVELMQWVVKDGRDTHILDNEVFQAEYMSLSTAIEPITADSAIEKIIARVRYGLVQTRPMSEADLICDLLVEKLVNKSNQNASAKVPAPKPGPAGNGGNA